jgi:hypothetical protein
MRGLAFLTANQGKRKGKENEGEAFKKEQPTKQRKTAGEIN